jgi:hypothetical protein
MIRFRFTTKDYLCNRMGSMVIITEKTAIRECEATGEVKLSAGLRTRPCVLRQRLKLASAAGAGYLACGHAKIWNRRGAFTPQ